MLLEKLTVVQLSYVYGSTSTLPYSPHATTQSHLHTLLLQHEIKILGVQLHIFLTSALDVGRWSASNSGRCTPGTHCTIPLTYTAIPRLTSDPDNEFFRLMNVSVDARANIKQQT